MLSQLTKPIANVMLVMAALLLNPVYVSASPPETTNSTPNASIELSGTFIDVVPHVAYETATLRISGPSGYALSKRFDSEAPLTADMLLEAELSMVRDAEPETKRAKPQELPLTTLPEGQYLYEVFFHNVAGDQRYHSGTFFVEDGNLVPAEAAIQGAHAKKKPVSGNAQNNVGLKGINHDDFVTVDDTAADNNTTFSLLNASFDQKDLRNIDGSLRIQESSSTGEVPHLTVTSIGDVGIGTATPNSTFEVLGNARITGAVPVLRLDNTSGAEVDWQVRESDDAFEVREAGVATHLHIAPGGNVDIPSGNIGMGTTSPAGDLHIIDAIPNIVLENSDGGERWEFRNNANDFTIFRDDGALERRMLIGDDGDVLLDADQKSLNFANAPLHVFRSDGSAHLRVEETASTEASRVAIQLINNGSPLLRYRDTGRGVTWTQNPVGDKFVINRAETGAFEFQLFNDGSAEFRGDVTANGVVLDSSREIKTDFSAVDEHTVLEKMAALEVSQWRYRQEPDTERHIGPMAEDFQATFGLGDGKHISVGDANGILFAAAKALKAETSRLEAESDAKDRQIAKLEARIARLEATLVD